MRPSGVAAPGCAAVIVTYHPDLPTVERLLGLLRDEVQSVFVVDNGSSEQVLERLDAAAVAAGAVVVRLGRNRGIAAAHNEGIALASRAGLDYVLLFDHDSLPEPGMAAGLLAAHETHNKEGQRVAGVGAMWVDQRSGRRGRFYRIRRGRIVGMDLADDAPAVEVDFLISSGSMLSLEAVRAIGAMREDFFIDHVDTEWCLRARRAGWLLYGVPAAQISHALGDSTRRVWLGRWREVALHSPERNYYEVRNTFLLLRTPGIGANWTVALLMRVAQQLVFYGLGVAPQGRRIARMARGMRDGLLGRGGPLS
ncbi:MULTISPECIES: glycosyltransferase family 2 protein [Ramlibacter]|uniref:Rhamnosyltransferase n=1 Tax=Ramlibacter pinisoli TaxID=2682844 RepID=A0A6N8IV28_9BURK|nr:MULTISPECIES: glycosyltransferase family 2 protein [Ramlibacter]MBA2964828.1 glycosyltransferase family 2 protein [Ramlibacter sp. CGMCC 1.13660]MVQ29793.1 rhamnosyltransferase [Ramlibacter pinisoli]